MMVPIELRAFCSEDDEPEGDFSDDEAQYNYED